MAVFISVAPNPTGLLDGAKARWALDSKIAQLQRFTEEFPQDPQARAARSALETLLLAKNDDQEISAYFEKHPETHAPGQSQQHLTTLLRVGRYADVLRETSAASEGIHDFFRDQQLLDLRLQALLAQGRYRLALQCVELWLMRYGGDGVVGGRFEGDVASARFLHRHLERLVRHVGASGPPIHTVGTHDPARGWNLRATPLRVVRLLPQPSGQLHESLTETLTDEQFIAELDQVNRGFSVLSQNRFSLGTPEFETVYLKEGDLDPQSSGGHPMVSRLFVQTVPTVARGAGNGFTLLVDFRDQASGESCYLGDGFIHISAKNVQWPTLMHEILHGLGATHQDWAELESQGYRFDPNDRGLMTFDHGQLRDFGLEEKNRTLLGWDAVSVVRLHATQPAEEMASSPGGDLVHAL